MREAVMTTRSPSARTGAAPPPPGRAVPRGKAAASHRTREARP
ncbi:hypothetical protein [Kitasatospora sp. NPDC018619]